ncbi:aldolase catalytic domain-containing protein [Teredinibacter purpureus]|uniref:aldolase catalytic domain-containing protein n=1 Tax=Teredinibacter purpureus TaxID=2731756 RepID=UPI0005F85DBB|nr:aldolase catalytic domain-containing protein [Teredinibacter purpureus]
MHEVKILDCTLRDGGYYNLWDFDPDVVQAYIEAMAKAKVDYVELGLRELPQKGFHGAFFYTTEDFINRLRLPNGPSYGVMVNAKSIMGSPKSIGDTVNDLFVDSKDSHVSIVRVAAHFDEVEKSEAIVKCLKDKGYIVGYNLMQAGGKPSAELAEKAGIVASWGQVDVLYFADSLGNMDGGEVKRIISALRECWSGDLGIHTHNNMARALDNCLVAKAAGVKWLDATVTGMGRGAGNSQTENLLAVISQESDSYVTTPVYELAIRHFEPMQKECGWGSNLLYFLGAQNNLHPTYIQNMLSDSHFGTDEIVGAIEFLSQQENRTSYNGDVYKAALTFSGEGKPVSGSPELCSVAHERDVLIVANGSSLQRYLRDIKAYIRNKKPIVIGINVIEELAEYIDYYCLSHNNKFLSERGIYNTLKKPVILPKHRFKDSELELFSGSCQLIDYGFEVKHNCFSVKNEYCVVPFDITAAYAFSVVETMNPKGVFLAGFDGYESADSRQLEMLEIFSMMNGLEISKRLIALTPTTYPLVQGSIYAPV